MDEIKGRMMEDIVLLETKIARKNCEVFKLQFAEQLCLQLSCQFSKTVL